MGRYSSHVRVSSFGACFSFYICMSAFLHVYPKHDQSSTVSDLLYLLMKSFT